MELLTLGDYPRIIAAGYDAKLIGECATFFLYDYVTVGGILRRRIVAEILRPQFELLGEHQDFYNKLNDGAGGTGLVRPVVFLQ